MRIGIDARFYGSVGKGLGRYTEKLIESLEKLPTEDDFFVFLRRENFDDYHPRHPNFTKVLADYPWYGWQEQCLFPRLLRRYNLDLMHFLHFNVPLLYRRPFLVTIHDLILLHYPTIKASELPPLLYWMKYMLYRGVIASALFRAKRIIAVSHFTQTDIATVYPKVRSKIRVTYEAALDRCAWLSPLERREALEKYGLAGQPFVLYVGNAYPHKNLDLIIELALMARDMTFVCVGREDYFYAALKRKVAEHHLDNVHFIGFVTDATLSLLYSEATSYLFPSLYEGFGLPGLEALAHGTPVVAARAGALPEILSDAALFFDPADGRAALASLRVLRTDQVVRSQLQQRGFERVAQFSWRRMALLTLREYHTRAV